MSAFTRQNVVYDIDESVKKYGDIDSANRGTCCCLNHIHQQHDLHRGGKGIILPQKSRSRSRKKSTISIIATSKSSASFLQQTNQNQDKKSCDCLKSDKKKRSKNEEKGIKMKRLMFMFAVFVIYVSLGAVAFNALEAGAELERRDELQDFVEQFLIGYPCVKRADLYKLLKKAVVDSEIVNYVVENKTHLDRWDFSGAFGFVVSVVTTIGFGNMSPFTLEGKVVCVVYAMFGIPLTLLVLGGLGEKMATFISKIRKCKNPMCHHTPRVNHILNISYIIFLGVVVIFVAPAAMMTYVEQWHFMEALYFCFTTLSTIGFGDYVIGIHETRLTNLYAHEFYEVFAYVWILVGLAYLSLVYRYITDTMVAKAQEVGKSTIKRLGPEFSKTLHVRSSPKSSASSRSSSLDRRGHHQNSIHTEDTELFCDIELGTRETGLDI